MDKNSDDYLGKNVNFLSKLKNSPRAVNQYRKLYNNLCANCKGKVLRNPRMLVEEYCKTCRREVKVRIEKVKRLMGLDK